jgi:hypothetical protein
MSLPSAAVVRRHIALTKACRQADSDAFQQLTGQPLPKLTRQSRSAPSSGEADDCLPESMEVEVNNDLSMDIDELPRSNPQSASSRRPSVEEVPDEDSLRSPPLAQAQDPRRRIIVEFPADWKAGEPISPSKTRFQVIQDEQHARNESRWGKFQNREAYETCEWLVKTTGQGDADDFLHLGFVRDVSAS